ncbi:uncharacterized protein LOC141665282 [Apium graveolens]|uniref:uncharacterized protein LOC141665282 n=1 Tax=Apium graveolens TaxID=4045 RepID=UPI003D7A6DF3
MYEDTWSWNREKMGHYSVRSAYKCIQEDKDHSAINSSNTIAWSRIWNLKIPQKVKIFMWRALSNCIPTKDQLLLRRVNVSYLCLKGLDPEELVKSATLSLNQWRIAQDKTFDNYLGFMTLADRNEHWQLPPEGTIKVNTDAAYFAESNTYAYAMVARDHIGSLLEAKTAGKHGHIDPMMAEALSIREALSWIKLKSWRKDLHSYDVRVNFVKRSANKVAHILVRNSSSIAERSWVKGDVLPHYFHVLSDDLRIQ